MNLLYEFMWIYVNLRCAFWILLSREFLDDIVAFLHQLVPILLNQGNGRKNSEEAQTAMTLCLKTPENSGKHFDTKVIGYGPHLHKMSQPTSGIASLAAKAGSAYPWTRELLVNLG